MNVDLLIKDLCARVPYGVNVVCKHNDGSMINIWEVLYINGRTHDVYLMNAQEKACKYDNIDDVEPLLLPLSSMTIEQQNSYNFLARSAYASHTGLMDFCNKHHLDYRGLIPMGAAIDATGMDIY